MYLLIISDTTCSEILNLKARSRSNRPSLKRVKNSESSSIGYNFLRHPTVIASAKLLLLFILMGAHFSFGRLRCCLASRLTPFRSSKRFFSRQKVLGTAKLNTYCGKVGISPFHIRISHVFLLCLLEGNPWNGKSGWLSLRLLQFAAAQQLCPTFFPFLQHLLQTGGSKLTYVPFFS